MSWSRGMAIPRFWLPPLLWTAVLLVFSGDLGASEHSLGIIHWLLSFFPPLSPRQILLIHGYLRKIIGHLLAYGFLSFLWLRAWRGHLGFSPGAGVLWSLLLCLVVAAVDEGHQVLVPTRTGNIWDVAWDMSGAVLVALISLKAWKVGPISETA
ncbi:MAG: VanZ family protein [Thermodesulfobacteriota bacterium]